MAVDARYSHVAAGKRKLRLLVPGKSKGRGMEGQVGVALLAVVLEGRTRELALVGILVAIRAESEFDLEESIAAGRDVALRARNRGVLARQRIGCSQVILDREGRWPPALDPMAGFAPAAVRAPGELAVVRIGLVAVRAVLVRNRTLEVHAGMTALAGHIQVLAEQREAGPGVVKARYEGALLPRTSVVAGVAALLEFTTMGIAVAVGAGIEVQAEVARRAVGAGCMAFLAGNLHVRTGEREAGPGVIDLLSRLPVGRVVALHAVRAQRSLVPVFVTANAGAR